MDAAEKSVLLKLIDSFALSNNDEKESTSDETPSYIKEPIEYIEKLKRRKLLLEEKSNFKTGDIVLWKDGLKNKRFPLYGEPCIVVKVYDTPIKNDDIPETEEIDIELGFISVDDEFLCFNYDSTRFKLHK